MMGEVQFFLYGLSLAFAASFLFSWAYYQHLLKQSEQYQKELAALWENYDEMEEAYTELQDRHEMISEIFDVTPSVIFVKNLRGQYMLVNDRLVDIYKERKENIIGKTDFEFLPPTVAKAVRENDAIVISSGKHVYNEETVPDLNGSPRLYSTSKFPLYNKSGKIYAVAGISTDITEMKTIEENLSLALGANGMGIFDWDITSDVHYWSEETKKLFDYEPDENFTFHKLMERIHPDDKEQVMRVTDQFLHQGKDYSLEYRVIQQNQSYRWLSLRVRPYLNEEGVPVRILGVCWDITAAKNNELALKEALDAREEFMKLVSHHVKTPLSSLKLRLQMAKRNIDKGDTNIYTKAFVDRLIEATETELDRLTKSAQELVP